MFLHLIATEKAIINLAAVQSYWRDEDPERLVLDLTNGDTFEVQSIDDVNAVETRLRILSGLTDQTAVMKQFMSQNVRSEVIYDDQAVCVNEIAIVEDTETDAGEPCAFVSMRTNQTTYEFDDGDDDSFFDKLQYLLDIGEQAAAVFEPIPTTATAEGDDEHL